MSSPQITTMFGRCGVSLTVDIFPGDGCRCAQIAPDALTWTAGVRARLGVHVRKTAGVSVLADLTAALSSGSVEVVDLTAPLSSETPLLELPPEFGQTARFELEEISRYDERGPAWYWNNFHTGEHTGTHFDAPIHWVTGKDRADVATVPVSAFIAPAVVIDVVERVAADPDFLIEIDDLEAFTAEHGPLPAGGWLLCRTGWSSRVTQAEMINNTATGPTSPGMSPECARWVAEESPLQGIGVETIGTDAGAAHSFDPPFPCHAFLLGNGKYGLAQLQNLSALPPTGAVVVAAPLRIVGGSGSPVRVLALVER
jgi:kynurenine formamidase